MRFRTTAILAALLVVVLLVSYFAGVFGPEREKPAEKGEKPVKEKETLLVEPPLEKIDKLRVERRGRGYLVFEKTEDNQWRIVEPIEARAVNWQVSQLARMVKELKVLDSFVPGKGDYADMDLAKLGLDEPVVKITAWGDDRRVQLLAGKNVLASEDTYVKLEGKDQVYVVDQNVRNKVKRDLNEYRDKQLWQIPTDKVVSLRIDQAGGEDFVAVKSDGKWVIESPVRAIGDKDQIKKAIDAVGRLRAEEFIDAEMDLAGYGLAEPRMTVTLVVEKKIEEKEEEENQQEAETQPTTQEAAEPKVERLEYVLQVGSETGLGVKQTYVKRADRKWVVTIKQDDLKKFTPDKTAWRDKKLFDGEVDQITRVDLGGRTDAFTLTKENGIWQVLNARADQGAVSDLLDALKQAKAVSFIDSPSADLKQEGLDQPVRTLAIYVTGRVEPVRLALGGLTASRLYRYVQRVGQDYLFVVPAEKVETLLQPALAYRDRKMLSVGTEQFRKIELTRDGITYVLKRGEKDRTWRVHEPVSALADQAAVSQLLRKLGRLQAEEYVAEGNLSAYGLDRPDVSVVLTGKFEVRQMPASRPTTTTSAPATQPRIEYITRRYPMVFKKREAAVYAALAEDKQVAKVSDEVYKAVRAELLQRDVFGDIETQQVDRLVIARGGRQFAFEKVQGRWRYPADPVFQVKASAVEDVIEALSDLQAKRFVDFEAEQLDRYGLDKPALVVEAYRGGERLARLSVGKEADDEGRFAICSGPKRWVFVISDSDVEKLDKQLKQFAQQ